MPVARSQPPAQPARAAQSAARTRRAPAQLLAFGGVGGENSCPVRPTRRASSSKGGRGVFIKKISVEPPPIPTLTMPAPPEPPKAARQSTASSTPNYSSTGGPSDARPRDKSSEFSRPRAQRRRNRNDALRAARLGEERTFDGVCGARDGIFREAASRSVRGRGGLTSFSRASTAKDRSPPRHDDHLDRVRSMSMLPLKRPTVLLPNSFSPLCRRRAPLRSAGQPANALAAAESAWTPGSCASVDDRKPIRPHPFESFSRRV